MTATLSTLPAGGIDPADPISRLLTWTGGDVLRVGGDCSGGEMDSYRGGMLSTRTLRRLAGAQLVSTSGGLPADVLLEQVRPYVPALASATPDEFVSWWVAECVTGLDVRAAARAGRRWEDQPEPEPEPELAPWPEWVDEWIGRLLHPPKVAYLCELAAWRFNGEPEPAAQLAPWAVKLRARFDRRCMSTAS